MEASALHQSVLAGTPGRSPLLRLRSDEQLIAMTRRGNQAAFEMLVQRYQPRLLAFCRHMLGSKEDAEDVLQEVFAASYNALLADTRPINTRPWLYRIARNRCLNHLRKPKQVGQDSMDVFERDHGTSTADTVHRREEFRQIVTDVSLLPETQRTALLLREIDALSYEHIAETMDTTVPSVKSLLVRARVSLAEASEARLLTCGEVRLELGQVAEGLTKTSAPVRRHLKSCKQCRVFRGELRSTTRALAAIYPIGPLIVLHKLGLAKLGIFGGAASGAAAAGGSGTVAGGAGIAAAGGAAAASGGAAAAGGAISAGIGTLAAKTAAGMAAAAIVTAGAVEVKQVAAPTAPPTAQVSALPTTHPASPAGPAASAQAKPAKAAKKEPAAPVEKAVAAEPVAAPAPVPVTPPVAVPTPPVTPPAVQEDEGTVTLPTPGEPASPPKNTTPTTTTPTTTTPPPPPPPPPPATTTPAPPPTVVAPPPPPPPPSGDQTTTPQPPPPPPPPPPGG